MPALAPAEWDVVLRQARHASLLARLEALAESAGLLATLPSRVRARLESARANVDQQHRLIRWEVTRIRRALRDLDVPLVLLKGAAYLHAELPAARGRQFNDVDILVPVERLRDVEAALLRAGWESTGMSAYDERYYREWSHELPPLVHKDRQIVLDVHHNILPPTGRLRPDPRRLLEAARPLGESGLRVLAPADMTLHCACHLFQSGELHKSLRDLSDLDALVRGFAAAPFWAELTARARVLDVERPLYYGLRFARRLLGTPVAPDVEPALARMAPPPPVRAAMDALVGLAIEPDHPTRPRRRIGLARRLLSVRHHWLRMPPLMLARHLTHKALARGRDTG
ncbi:MAG TPA: nucleotidyltransferase family protein [Methylomirabilota bacterium]|nr:nucleotidyltransferase family protein [Methylomirabilota bacterium]